ncbi:reverse transcriptase N-terminal domain-containing protein [Streptomyces sp. NPDC002588]|uniref:reverse transcriptase N-terminal domain-containing protein n=1 Tax=Streptomyces sp. NPDC002588 TaxID=3154419 RepID=UPI003332B45C
MKNAVGQEPEPKGKLGTVTVIPAADPAATSTGPVNGPEDAPPDWEAIDWQAQEEPVRRLRQRIFTASQAGDLKKVRNLQKLMLRSRANLDSSAGFGR